MLRRSAAACFRVTYDLTLLVITYSAKEEIIAVENKEKSGIRALNRYIFVENVNSIVLDVEFLERQEKVLR